MRTGDTLPNPCFLLSLIQILVKVRMMILPNLWLCGQRPSCGVAIAPSFLSIWNLKSPPACVLLFSNYWYANLSIYHVLPLEILDLCFRPMVLVAQGLEYHNWNSILSVSLWSQADIIATIFKHQLRSHTTYQIHGQQIWCCLYACKTHEWQRYWGAG
jgi:hypothetical protein